jgi:hypothetical protein
MIGRRRRRAPRAPGLAAALCVLSGCASAPQAPQGPRTLLDERTGVTLSAVSEPLQFARVRADGATVTRDFAILVGVERDQAGRFSELLLLYRWSAPAPAPATVAAAPAGRLLLGIDDRWVEFAPLATNPIDASQRQNLFAPAVPGLVTFAYRTDFETMRAIAAGGTLTLRLPQESPDAPFALWRDGRPALAQLVQQLSGS